MNRIAGHSADEDQPTTPYSHLAVRILWMFFGNAALVLSALAIASPASVNRSMTADLIFWASVVTIAIARYIDVAWCGGSNVYGQPATIQDWKRHVIKLALIAPLIWLLAHLVGFFGR